LILLSGLPRSGNNVLRHHIIRCREVGTAEQQMEKVLVWHGTEVLRDDGSDLRFVIPVRNPVIRVLAMRRNRMPEARWPEDVCRRAVFCKIAERAAPVKLVSYEAFVQDPDAVAGDLIEWLELPWRPFPASTSMSPNPPFDGPVFDGNSKYQTKPTS